LTELEDNNILQDHEKRITDLEKNYAEVKKDLAVVNNSQLRMETTLLNESREQKILLNKLIDHQFGLNKLNLAGKWQFWAATVGSGGVLYLILEFLTK
jgi:hypothetical protein